MEERDIYFSPVGIFRGELKDDNGLQLHSFSSIYNMNRMGLLRPMLFLYPPTLRSADSNIDGLTRERSHGLGPLMAPF
jgi:hypothetical protein